MLRLPLFVSVVVLPWVISGCAQPARSPEAAAEQLPPARAAAAAPTPAPADAHGSHAAGPVKPPTLADQKPANYAGLHNVVAYADELYSGSVPEGDEGFATLESMGIHTIVSVDGAVPDVDAAKAHGMRYVHLPIGYNGMSQERTLEIAKACKDLPGPVYLHCHHGKHRSAGALAAAAVTLGLLTNEQATARMKVSGTAPNYTGLYKCAAIASPADPKVLASMPQYFPERSTPSGLVASMTVIDEANDELKLIEKAGWTTPANHADLVPASIAGHMADLLRTGAEDDAAKARSKELVEWMVAASKQVESLEEGITSGVAPEELSKRMQAVQQACKECHAKHRD